MLRKNEVVGVVKQILDEEYGYGGRIPPDRNYNAAKKVVDQVFKMVLDGRPTGS